MNLEANKEALLGAIKQERAYQDAKWGPLSECKFKSLAGWYLIAREELLEAQDAFNSHSGNEEAKAELLQFIAIGYACMEQVGLELDEEALPYYSEQARDFEEWLVAIEARLDQVKQDLWSITKGNAEYRFLCSISMAMACLLQHGVVSRGERVFEECMSCEGIFDATGYDIEDACPLCRQRWTREHQP